MDNSSAVHNLLDSSEALLPTTRPTVSYYLVSALVIIPFCAVTPASWCYVVYSLYTGAIWTFTLRQYVLFAAALIEVGPISGLARDIQWQTMWARIYPDFLQRIPL